MKLTGVKHLLRYLWYLIAGLIIASAVFLNIVRLSIGLFGQHTDYFQKMAQRLLRVPVEISAVSVSLHDLRPSITLENVVLYDKAKQSSLLRIKHLGIEVSLWQSLLQHRVVPTRFVLSGSTFSVQQKKEGSFTLQGLPGPLQKTTRHHHMRWDKTLWWLVTQGDVRLNHINVNLTMRGQTVLLRDLQFNVVNHHLQHALFGSVKLADSSTEVAFKLKLYGKHIQLQHLHGDAYVNLQHVDLAKWRQMLPLQWSSFGLPRGKVSLALWVKWLNSSVESATAQVRLDKVSLQRNHKKTITINRAASTIFLSRHSHDWSLLFNDTRLSLAGKVWPTFQLLLSRKKVAPSGQLKEMINVRQVSLQRLRELALWLDLPHKLNHLSWRDIEVGGLIRSLYFVRTLQQDKLLDWSASSDFSEVFVKHKKRHVSLGAFSGRAFLLPDQLQFNVDSNHFKLTQSKWYAKPLSLGKVQAKGWFDLLDQGDYHLVMPHVSVENPDMRLSGALRLDKTKQVTSPVVQAKLALKGVHASYFHQLVPDQLAAPALTKWFKQAFTAGMITEGVIDWRGGLADFPYEKAPGHFSVVLQLQDIGLHYQSHWLPLTGLRARLRINGRQLEIDRANGEINHIPMSNIHATIADLAHARLLVQANGQGELGRGVDFLVRSPLAAAKSLAMLDTTGPMRLHLNLDIPLSQKHQPLSAQGEVAFEKNKLRLPQWGITLKELTGALTFHNRDLSADKLQAHYEGHALALHVSTPKTKQAKPSIAIALTGLFPGALLKDKLRLPAWLQASGQADFSGLLRLYGAGSAKADHFTLTSQLRGMGLKVASYYSKPKTERIPFAMTLALPHDAQPIRLNMHYGTLSQANYLQFLADLAWSKQQLALTRAKISIGQQAKKLTHARGLDVDWYIRTFSWSYWRDFYDKLLSGKKAPDLGLSQFRLQTDRFLIDQHYFHQVDLTLRPKQQQWQLALKGRELAGQALIPRKLMSAPIDVKLSYLNWQPDKQAHIPSLNPVTLPALHMTVDRFSYRDGLLGKLSLVTSRVKKGMRLDGFDLTSKQHSLHLTGAWWLQGKQSHANLAGQVKVNDMGSLLSRWQVTDALVGGSGVTTFNLSWPGMLLDPDVALMSGHMDTALTNGRITHLGKQAESKLGVGRLLNLFSLSELPKRLMFNFSDVTKKGLAFDVLQGNFSLKNGVATTKDAYLDGSVAKVAAQGQIDFAGKSYDLRLEVMPHLTSSLPVIATLTGGPIAGAVSWIFDKVVSHQMSKSPQVVYVIKGPWSKPDIKPLHPPATPAAERDNVNDTSNL